MSIKSDAKELLKIIYEIIKEKELNIDDVTKPGSECLDDIWNEAIKKFEGKEASEVDFYKNDSWSYINKIKKIESYLEQKKYELNFENRESSQGVITGLEIALAILL